MEGVHGTRRLTAPAPQATTWRRQTSDRAVERSRSGREREGGRELTDPQLPSTTTSIMMYLRSIPSNYGRSPMRPTLFYPSTSVNSSLVKQTRRERDNTKRNKQERRGRNKEQNYKNKANKVLVTAERSKRTNGRNMNTNANTKKQKTTGKELEERS